MKSLSHLLVTTTTALACVGSCLAADAAETIVVKAQVRQGETTLAVPQVAVESGKTATIRTGAIDLSLQPTVRADGSITIAATLTTGADTPKPVQVARPTLHVLGGQTATIEVGEWKISLTPDVAK